MMQEVARRTTHEEPTSRSPFAEGDGLFRAKGPTPREIVAELDRYIIGQDDAKRAVAVALRNRFRRQQLPEELRNEVHPKNILMIGPTGVGKSEIARRVARIVEAPFIKVEATKFTEVGYVGRDVESLVRDLVEVAISMIHNERLDQVRDQAAQSAVNRLAEILSDQLIRSRPQRRPNRSAEHQRNERTPEKEAQLANRRRQREQKRVLRLLDEEAMEDETVEIELEADGHDEAPLVIDFGGHGDDDLQDPVQELLDGLIPPRRMRRRVSVREARRILVNQEANRMVDFDSVVETAVQRVENGAVVFLDEIDKVISGSDADVGADISGEGVQRDLLPIIEGSTVMTRYGPVKTDHVLFIAAGAFHKARPADLIPELQGRFPIRVELQSLTEDDQYRILTEPQNALTKQYEALLRTEDLTLTFRDDGLREIARLATQFNSTSEDIGARRLQTIMERVLEDVSFDASERAGETVEIDKAFVGFRIADIAEDTDLADFIL